MTHWHPRTFLNNTLGFFLNLNLDFLVYMSYFPIYSDGNICFSNLIWIWVVHLWSHVADWLSHACFLPQTPRNVSVWGVSAWGLHPHQFREYHHIPSVWSLLQSETDHPFLDTSLFRQKPLSKRCIGRESFLGKFYPRSQRKVAVNLFWIVQMYLHYFLNHCYCQGAHTSRDLWFFIETSDFHI